MRTVKNLPCKLTDDEVHKRACQAADLAGEVNAKESALEQAKERAKAIVKDAEVALAGKRGEMSMLARIARERVEYREIECEERIVRAERRRIITRLDTAEVIESEPVSDEEMRRGARWRPSVEQGRSELRHPDEPEVLLDTRPLSDAERQVPLPGADGTVRATTLAEAAAIAAATEAGDLSEDVLARSTPVDIVGDAPAPATGKRLSLSERVWLEHREGLLDAKGLALHRQWRKSSTLRMVDIEAGPTLDLVLAYAAEQGIELQTTEPF